MLGQLSLIQKWIYSIKVIQVLILINCNYYFYYFRKNLNIVKYRLTKCLIK